MAEEQLDRLKIALADRYAVQRELGSGGMAIVYLAEDTKHHREVAVKVFRPELAAALGADRFLREIEIAAGLHHPHILPLYDSGEMGGYLYYVMPYIDGESLRARLSRQGELPISFATQVIGEVADALAYAHSRKVVHRDIKPDNVMLSGRHALVMDFGVAKAVSVAADGDNLTTAGASLGTPTYMAPEQVAADPNLDHRADIYALGVVAYELLAGRPPFSGDTPQMVMSAHVTQTPSPVTAHRAAVSPELAALVMRCLEKQPADRWQQAEEIVDRLLMLSTPAGGVVGATGLPPITKDHSTPTERAIAVLPFQNLSADEENEYFSDGITEEIINALNKIASLRVAARSSSFAYKRKNIDVRKVGEDLHVNAVLEGSVRKAGKRLRITAQLISVNDGYQLWSERYDRELEDVFAIQDEISEAIVSALRVVLTEDEKPAASKGQTEHVEAYDYYLRGRQYFHQFRQKSLQYARRMFSRAVEFDAQYTLAYAGIADTCSFLYMFFDASDANLSQADTSSRKALELSPDLAEAHVSRGLALTLNRNYGEAEREFETAVGLDPKHFEAHYFFARACVEQGKLERAVELFDQARRIRPEDYQAPHFMAQAYQMQGMAEEALTAFGEARARAEKHLQLNPDDARALCIGAADLARLDERDRALEWVRRARDVDPEDAVVLYNVACVLATLGQRDEAIETIAQAIENGFGHRGWIANDPDLDPLRDNPRFQALLDQIG